MTVKPTSDDMARDLLADAVVVSAYLHPDGNAQMLRRDAIHRLARVAQIADAAIRRAVAAEAERDALIKLSQGGVDTLLDCWDQTEAHVQRGIVSGMAAMIEDLRQCAADRASGDPEVRDLLLYEFGTTEPDLLREAIAALRPHRPVTE